jgi:hypothetical protein
MPNKLKPQLAVKIANSKAFGQNSLEPMYQLQALQIQCLSAIHKSKSEKIIRAAEKTYNMATFYLIRDFDMDAELMYSRTEMAAKAEREIGVLHNQCKRKKPEMAHQCENQSQLQNFIDKVFANNANYLGFELKVLASIKKKVNELKFSTEKPAENHRSYNELAACLLIGS